MFLVRMFLTLGFGIALAWPTVTLAMADAARSTVAQRSPQTLPETGQSAAQIEEVVVVSSRLPAATRAAVVGIDRAQIASIQSGSLVDLLRRLGGANGYEAGGIGGESEVFLRGADANFATILIDGVVANDVTDARGGAVDLGAIALHEIERIDMVQGPSTVLHGAGGLGGVIAITTVPRVQDDVGGSVAIDAGSDDFWRAGLQLAAPVGRGQGSVAINSIDVGAPTPGVMRTGTSVSAAYRQNYAAGGEFRLHVRGHEQEREGFPIASGGPRGAVVREVERSDAEQIGFGASIKHPWSSGVLHANLAYFEREETLLTPAIAPGAFQGIPASQRTSQFDRLAFSVYSSVDVRDWLQISAGGEFRTEDGDTEGGLDFGFFTLPTDFDEQRDTRAAFAELALDVAPGWVAQVALRHDDRSDVGVGSNARVQLRYAPDDTAWGFDLSYADGSKAPSFYALGDPLVGNPSLAEEDNRGFEARVRWQPSTRLQMQLSAYRYEYEGLIDFDFATFALVNRGEIDSRGIQLRVNGALNPQLRWRFEGDLVDYDGATRLLHRPERSAQLSVFWEPREAWQLVLSNRYVGARASSSIPDGMVQLDGHVRTDLALSHRLSRELQLRLSVDNLLDVPIEPVAGFRDGGTHVRLGLSRRF
ncbi:MAG: TonB-dependent receptor [Pseudomonadota bacterium]